MNLEQLRARLKALIEGNDAITTKDTFTADDLKTLDANSLEIEQISGQIKTIERALALKASTAIPAGAGTQAAVDATGTETAPATVKQPQTAWEKIGLMVGALAKHNADRSKQPLAYLDEAGYGPLAKDVARAMKTLNTTSAVSGGLLVPEDISNEMVELLRPTTSFLQGPGLRRIPMPNGNYTLPAVATGAAASYTTEGENAAVTEETWREVNMNAKTLAALVPITNDLLNWSIPGLKAFVEADLRDALSEKLDAMAYRGDGMAGNPLGIFNIPGITQFTATNSATPTPAQIDADLRKAMNIMVLGNVAMANLAWVMPALYTGYLEDLRDGNGNQVYPEVAGDRPRIKGIPILRTTNLPTNLGAGSDEGQIALVKFSDVMFGEASGLQLAVSSEAMIEIGGAKLSLFQRRMTAIMAVMQHDFNIRRLLAVVVINGVKWGK